jgi:hypothetical protein
MTKEQIHHERKDYKVFFSCLILVYKRNKRRPDTINFRGDDFGREGIRIFYKTS